MIQLKSIYTDDHFDFIRESSAAALKLQGYHENMNSHNMVIYA